MSRSGYTDDCDAEDGAFAMWRGRVASATRGKRGQVLLHEIEAALVSMPEKALISSEFCTKAGDVCALGARAVAEREKRGHERRAAVESLARKSRAMLARCGYADEEYGEAMTEDVDAATCLLQEIQYENDEAGPCDETPQERHARVLRWVRSKIKPEAVTP